MAYTRPKKDPYKGKYGKDLVNACSDKNGNITTDVGYILLMGREDKDFVIHRGDPKLRNYMADFAIGN